MGLPEALSEVGNVIFNACIATIVDTLDVPIEVEIPQNVRRELSICSS